MLSVIGAALLLVGPLGTRVGLWSFLIGFMMLAASVLLALVGASLGLVGGIKTGQWPLAGTAIVVGLAVVAVPSAFIVSARGKPAIHDITTDTDNPPAFVAVLPLRAGAANPPEYPGAEVAAQVRTGCVAVNSGSIVDFNGPFGGFKKSGIGRELGPEGIGPYTEYQTIILPAQG